MKHPADHPSPNPPAAWSLVLAFGLVYLSWGTTYLATKEGVQVQGMPPALFGGVRVCLAGLLLLGFLAWRGERIGLCRRDLAGIAVTGLVMFVGGNGLINVAQTTVPSGVAAVLAATTPLWIGLLEMFWPGGERLTGRGWLGLFLGLGGILVLLAPRLEAPGTLLENPGVLIVLGSALCWSLGSLLVRHHRPPVPHLAAAAYQMVVGGGGLALVGLAAGEARELTAEHLTARAGIAFAYLLVVGSLVGFVSYNWLLGHVPAAQAGTYAYVNPVVALLVGWLFGNEAVTGWIVGGMVIILAGVGLVRGGGLRRPVVGEAGAAPSCTDGAAAHARDVPCWTAGPGTEAVNRRSGRGYRQ
jgi:drug/metabolite transporter (DMT)-like permease